MFTPPLCQTQSECQRATRTVRDRPPVRLALQFARWSTVAVLGLSTACASVQIGGPSFGAARFSNLPAAGSAFASTRPAASLYAPNIAIGDPLLAATVTRLRKLSPAFDSAMAAVEASGIPVVIGTAEQLRDQLPPGYRYVGGWQALTAVYPLTPNGDRGKPIEHVAVIVRLSELRAAMNGYATEADSATFDHFVERVVAHEIYGHLMPQLRLGKTAPIACDDPTSSADWYTACVMQRERHVMAQLSSARGTFATLGTR
jgi:hypothetical protein